MKRSPLIKVAAVAAIVALGGVALAHDALAWNRFKSGHVANGKRSANKVQDNGRRVSAIRPPQSVGVPSSIAATAEEYRWRVIRECDN